MQTGLVALKLCGLLTATLAMPAAHATRMAEALTHTARLPVIWLEFQGCTGDTESFLRASNPSAAALLLETISLEYHETVMAAAGTAAEQARQNVITTYPHQYFAIVEGAIPTAANGAYCTIAGRSALDIVQEVCGNALATITVGSCGWDGGLPAANPDPTTAVGASTAVPGLTNILSLPGCPMNVVNLTAAITYYLTYGALPPADEHGRPLFAYGHEIHETCPRRHFYENEQFVEAWGDAGHRQGWCLYEMGCRGPESHSNCNQVMWNEGTNWPIGAGHPCIGCVEPHFWDNLSPFYEED